MAKTWRCAVVGTGTVGDWHVRVIPKLANAELVALCDIQPEKARALIAKYQLGNIPVYADEAELLAKEKLDVIHLCTPSGNHLDPAVMAMEAGKNVICEKPLEIAPERIDRMIAAAGKNKVKLAGIFQNRWNDANRALRQAAQEGRFGRIAWAGCFTPWYRPDQYYRDGGWRGTWKLDGGGAIMNQSVHAIDLLQWIAGPIKQVSAYAASRIHAEIEVEDTMSASVLFENGGFGTIMGTTAMYPGGAVRVEIGGENGSGVAEAGFGLRSYRFRDERPEDKALIERINAKPATSAGSSAINQGQDLHTRNISAIFQAWDEGQEAETCGAEARKAVAIIVALYESARKNGAPVAVK